MALAIPARIEFTKIPECVISLWFHTGASQKSPNYFLKAPDVMVKTISQPIPWVLITKLQVKKGMLRDIKKRQHSKYTRPTDFIHSANKNFKHFCKITSKISWLHSILFLLC